MSKDPFLAREAQKYASPIASREYLLQLITEHKTPMSYEELASQLDLHSDEALDGLRRRLRAMERDGQLVYTRRKCYALPERLDLVRGQVIGHRDGYGFLRAEGRKEDLYLPSDQLKGVIHGDIILAQPLGNDRRGRTEVRVVRILEPSTKQIVGRYFTDAGIGFVVPDDNRLNFDILIPKESINGAKMGAVVVVELLQRATRRTKAIGQIVEVLGDTMGAGIAVDIAIRNHDIPYEWPEAVQTQTTTFTEQVSEADKAGRIDLRSLGLMTIDGEDARDFDDAVYCEKKRGGGWRLWVAIADVSYYVRPGKPIDQEARKRGTSVYFPSRVIPMLPEVLSNGLCSLNPQVDRLCMVCEMTVSAQGRLSSYKFYEAVMSSHARLTYNKVAAMLKGDAELIERYQPLVPALTELHRLYQALEQARELRGGISFESEEPKFIFNAEKRIERIEPLIRNDAHKIIEECMILANVAAARFVEKAGEPALYRVHDKPKSENLVSVRSVLAELGLSLGGGDDPQPKDYAELMDLVADRPDHELLQTLLLRSMKQAIYDPENRGHFGLALTSYAHFTSPIRRYPDLSLHRAIKYLLAKEQGATGKVLTHTGGWHYEMAEMVQLGEHCSMAERRADEATREVVDWLKCDFMQDHIGETFGGTISGVTGFGFFVRLDELYIDGLVHVSNLANDYYRLDHLGHRLIGEASGQTYQLGDKVEVKVIGVHPEERNIDFALVSAKRVVRGAGKTAKQRHKETKPTTRSTKSDKSTGSRRRKTETVKAEKPKRNAPTRRNKNKKTQQQ